MRQQPIAASPQLAQRVHLLTVAAAPSPTHVAASASPAASLALAYRGSVAGCRTDNVKPLGASLSEASLARALQSGGSRAPLQAQALPGAAPLSVAKTSPMAVQQMTAVMTPSPASSSGAQPQSSPAVSAASPSLGTWPQWTWPEEPASPVTTLTATAPAAMQLQTASPGQESLSAEAEAIEDEVTAAELQKAMQALYGFFTVDQVRSIASTPPQQFASVNLGPRAETQQAEKAKQLRLALRILSKNTPQGETFREMLLTSANNGHERRSSRAHPADSPPPAQRGQLSSPRRTSWNALRSPRSQLTLQSPRSPGPCSPRPLQSPRKDEAPLVRPSASTPALAAADAGMQEHPHPMCSSSPGHARLFGARPQQDGESIAAMAFMALRGSPGGSLARRATDAALNLAASPAGSDDEMGSNKERRASNSLGRRISKVLQTPRMTPTSNRRILSPDGGSSLTLGRVVNPWAVAPRLSLGSPPLSPIETGRHIGSDRCMSPSMSSGPPREASPGSPLSPSRQMIGGRRRGPGVGSFGLPAWLKEPADKDARGGSKTSSSTSRASAARMRRPSHREGCQRAIAAQFAPGGLYSEDGEGSLVAASQPRSRNTSPTPSRGNLGSALDFYVIGKLIGRGAFGKVNIGVHKLTEELTAMKLCERRRVAEMQSKKCLSQEVAVLKRLNGHVNIIQLFEVIETPNYVVLVMEYASGGDLLRYVKQRCRVEEHVAQDLFKQLADGLHYIHLCSIVHRDLKLDNLLLDAVDCLKIADFGVASIVTPGKRLTGHCGTPSYMAPEVMEASPYDGPPVDVWSLGVVLYALLCGRVPFKGENLQELKKCIYRGRPVIPPQLGSNAVSLLLQTLIIDPKRRLTVQAVLGHPWLAGIKNRAESLRALSSVKETRSSDIGSHMRSQDSLNENSSSLAALAHSREASGGGSAISTSMIAQVASFGFPEEYVTESLRGRCLNHATATYYLLQQQGIKKRFAEESATASSSINGGTGGLASEPLGLHDMEESVDSIGEFGESSDEL